MVARKLAQAVGFPKRAFPKYAPRALIKSALDAGTRDNVTVVVIDFKEAS